ncbi:MAG: AAA family ATPase [Candidatus Helarchaeota archaeon]|nr:AAA family ATPase [Candidatus Helarchaeota archaeon]
MGYNEDENDIEKFLTGKSVFKNEQTLDLSYVPPKLPRRREELARLSRDFKPLVSKNGSYSINVAMIGPAGVGKTATTKYFCERFVKAAQKRSAEIIYTYYNCYTFRTKSAILRNLLSKYFTITSRGYSDYELLGMLTLRLKKEHKHLLIVLDEANIIGAEDILSIIHAPEIHGFGEARISTIIISRPTEFQSLLNAPLSGHINDKIQLNGYNQDELKEILDYRADLAFHPAAISEDIVDMVVDIASKTLNARHGIEIMYHAGKIADREDTDSISEEMIRTAKGYVYPELRPDILNDLRVHELLTALAIAKRLKHAGITATTVNESYDYYCVACDEYAVHANAKPTFRRHLDTLTNMGIIGKSILPLHRGRRGRRGRITLYDIPATILEERTRLLIEMQLKSSDTDKKE